MKTKIKELYGIILRNKIASICILFTVFTLLDTTIILAGLSPPKEGIDAYVHLLGRFVLMTALIFDIYFFDLLRKKIKYSILVYVLIFVITWLMLFGYLKLNGLFTDLHQDAVYYMTRSFAALYLFIGLIYLIYNFIKKRINRMNEQ